MDSFLSLLVFLFLPLFRIHVRVSVPSKHTHMHLSGTETVIGYLLLLKYSVQGTVPRTFLGASTGWQVVSYVHSTHGVADVYQRPPSQFQPRDRASSRALILCTLHVNRIRQVRFIRYAQIPRLLRQKKYLDTLPYRTCTIHHRRPSPPEPSTKTLATPSKLQYVILTRCSVLNWLNTNIPMTLIAKAVSSSYQMG
jgi:hypothetical protein